MCRFLSVRRVAAALPPTVPGTSARKRIKEKKSGRTPAPMHVAQRHTVGKALEIEHNLHNLHTLQYRLIWLYTWPQKARKWKNQKFTAHMHHTCTLSGRKPPQEPFPPLHHRWRGG